jgi:hypothetical protein
MHITRLRKKNKLILFSTDNGFGLVATIQQWKNACCLVWMIELETWWWKVKACGNRWKVEWRVENTCFPISLLTHIPSTIPWRIIKQAFPMVQKGTFIGVGAYVVLNECFCIVWLTISNVCGCVSPSFSYSLSNSYFPS